MKTFPRFFCPLRGAVPVMACLFVWLFGGMPSCAASAEAKSTGGTPAEFGLQTWQADNGLPGNIVHAITQTPNGYLWIGTDGGLARFDGIRFQTFPIADAHPGSGQQISALCVDKQSRLWVATASGLIGQFIGTRFEAVPSEKYPLTAPVIALVPDPAGGVWVLDASGSLSRLLDGEATGNVQGILEMAVDGNGRAWTNDGTSLRRYRDGQWEEVFRSEGGALHLGARCAGGVWVVANHRLLAVDPDAQVQEFAPLPWANDGTEVRQLFEDRQGGLWIGTNGKGLYRFAGGQFLPVQTSQKNILSITQDAEENILVGLQGGGLNRLNQHQIGSFDRGLSNEVVLSVAQDREGRIWASPLFGGLGFIRGDAWESLGVSEKWGNWSANCLSPTPDGRMWVGAMDHGLSFWENGHLTTFDLREHMPTGGIDALFTDSRGRLWIGTSSSGLLCLENGKITCFTKSDGLPEEDIRAIAEDGSGVLWIGMGGKGSLATWKDGKIQALPASLWPAFPIRVIVPSADGVVWIGTVGGGLFRLKENLLTRMTSLDGLPSETVSQLLLDSDGHLWGGTDQGLFRASLRDLNAFAEGNIRSVAFDLFGRGDGLRALQFMGGYQPVAWKARDGTFWMATVKGLVTFQPSQIRPRPQPPIAIIEEITCNGLAQPARNGLQLPAGVEELRIQFTSPGLSAPERLRFRHKLDGVDPDWVEGGTSRVVTYRNVPPGRHLFRVGVSDPSQAGEDRMTNLSFTVSPEFWQTRWFFAASAAAAAAALVLGIRWGMVRRLRRRLQIVEQNQALEKERIRIARDLHDDVGSNLSSIVLLYQMCPAPASSELADIRRVASETIEALRDIVWFINPAYDRLGDLIERMNAACADLLPALPHTFECGTIPAETKLAPTFRRNLLPAFKESLHNAAQHSGATHIGIRADLSDGIFCFSISDNGTGFDESRVTLGNGLRSLRRRAAELGGEVRIESGLDGTGTRVTFSAPLT
jgi:signal transduction histidine kinase/ligand-binding sensor domain-containing protein